jgi:hypothetical protein
MKCMSCGSDHPSDIHFAVPGICLACFEKLPETEQGKLKGRADATGSTEFDVYVRQEDGQRVGTAIKRGFCWPGLLFTWMWAFANRLWLVGVVIIVVMIPLLVLWVYFSEEGSAVGWVFLLLNTWIAVVVGFKGNDLRRARREAAGFRKAVTVQGNTPSQVLETAGIPQAGSFWPTAWAA